MKFKENHKTHNKIFKLTKKEKTLKNKFIYQIDFFVNGIM